MKKLKIVVKFPTRARPLRFLEVFTKYVGTCTDKENTSYLISYDQDDTRMSPPVIQKALSLDKNVKAICGFSKGKIAACNRDMNQAGDWDILILGSDDMVPFAHGWDEVIRQNMDRHYKDLDGVLYFPDGYTALNTMCIMGRKYYERFNYIYHPEYMSLWCDNEFMHVAESLRKQTKINQILFKHEHPANKRGLGNDNLYSINEGYYHRDKEVFMRRKAKNFNL